MMVDKPFSPACERNREPILTVLRDHFADRHQVLEIGSGSGQHAVYFAAAMPWLAWQCSDVAENLPGIRMWLDEAGLANTPAPLELDVRGPWLLPPLPQVGEGSTVFDAVFSANTLHIMGWAEVEAFFAGVDRVLDCASGDVYPSSSLRASRSAPQPVRAAPKRSSSREPWFANAPLHPEGEGTAHILSATAREEEPARALPSPLVGEGPLRGAKQGEGRRGGTLVVYGPFNHGGHYTSDSNRVFDGWLQARDPRSAIRDFEAVDALARAIGLRLVADVAMPANNRCLVWRR